LSEEVGEDALEVERAEVVEDGVDGEAEFEVAEEVVVDAVFPVDGIGDAVGALEPVEPAEPGEAEGSLAGLVVFGVDVAFFAAEASEGGVEA
jgi:hypothetical protein